MRRNNMCKSRRDIGRPVFGLTAVCFLMISGTGTLHAAAQPMTFAEVMALPTTLSGWDFDTPGFGVETDMYYNLKGRTPDDSNDPSRFLRDHPNGWRNSFTPGSISSLGNVSANLDNAAGVFVYPKRTAEKARFPGDNSLKFRIVDRAGETASGDFLEVFRRNWDEKNIGTSKFTAFGAGGEFWFRWTEYDSASLAGDWEKGNGVQLQPPGRDPKRLIVHSETSSPGSRGGLQFVLRDKNQRGYVDIYEDSGVTTPMNSDPDQGMDGTSTSGCDYTGNDSPSGYGEPPCSRLPEERWKVFHMHIKVADNAPDYNNGYVEVYEGDSTVPIIQHGLPGTGTSNPDDADLFHPTSPIIGKVDNYNWSTGTDPKAYWKYSFTLWISNMTRSSHPELSMYVDNIVVSETRCPPLKVPGAGQDSLLPSSPTNVQAQ